MQQRLGVEEEEKEEEEEERPSGLERVLLCTSTVLTYRVGFTRRRPSQTQPALTRLSAPLLLSLLCLFPLSHLSRVSLRLCSGIRARDETGGDGTGGEERRGDSRGSFDGGVVRRGRCGGACSRVGELKF